MENVSESIIQLHIVLKVRTSWQHLFMSETVTLMNGGAALASGQRFGTKQLAFLTLPVSTPESLDLKHVGLLENPGNYGVEHQSSIKAASKQQNRRKG